MGWMDRLVRRLEAPEKPFVASAIGDPVALATEWTPCKRGGTNMCTHRLSRVSSDTVRFRPTVRIIVFCVLFFSMGVAVLGLGVGSATGGVVVRGGSRTSAVIACLLVGLVFAGAGGALLLRAVRPIRFDRGRRMFWRGWGEPRDAARGCPTSIPFDRIHALQIVSEYCSGRRSFWSYELNLVLDDASRVNVVDHGDLVQLRQDARTLASFVGVPLWDPS